MARDSGQARRRARGPVRLDGPRSAHMGRRGRPPELQIRSAFEATRTAAQCLAEAYECLVPIPRACLGCLQPAAHVLPWPPTLNPGRGALSVGRIVTALYARVSSDGQARGNTVASQLAELRARAAADGVVVGPEHSYVDEGYSGATLARPALERLRDAAAQGEFERLYVHAPDRLARRYAYQVLLVEELRRAGV